MERKFTDEEVIKALECCANADCLNCPRWTEEWGSGMCADFLPSVLDLINRQKAEIEILNKAVESECDSCACALLDERDNARAEAIKEFAERLKEEPIKCGLPLFGLTTKGEIEAYYNSILLQVRDAIDSLVEEMTEGK